MIYGIFSFENAASLRLLFQAETPKLFLSFCPTTNGNFKLSSFCSPGFPSTMPISSKPVLTSRAFGAHVISATFLPYRLHIRLPVGFWGMRGRFPSSDSRLRSRRTSLLPNRVYCRLQVDPDGASLDAAVQVRRCSPFLESEIIPNIQDMGIKEWKAVPDIWSYSAEKFGDRVALVDVYHEPKSKFTYKQLKQEILYFSEGLRVVGVNPEEKIALFADNSCRWLVADQGIMATGAINVVRGTRSSVEELSFIYQHSESIALVVDSPSFFNRIADKLTLKNGIRFVILLWGETATSNTGALSETKIFSYQEIIDFGKESYSSLLSASRTGKYLTQMIALTDIATLIYTSGTTGSPKGVMLTHGNLLHQIKNLWEIVPAVSGDRFLSILPPWHVYERSCEYFIFTYGIEQVYTNVKNLKDDLRQYQPHYLISVPLIYETLYSAIQKQINASSTLRKIIALNSIKISLTYMNFKRLYEGKVLSKMEKQQNFIYIIFEWLLGRIASAILWPLHNLAEWLVYKKIRSVIGISKAGISGGGSLPLHIDKFFEAIGVKVQNGYGLTETSPVIAARRPTCNVLGTCGHPICDTEVKIVDFETGVTVPDGSKGLIKVKGPQVMKGYYKNLAATNEAIDAVGWLNTGDLGWIAPKNVIGRSRCCSGMLVIEGRAKDTIVLSTGENVEPSELEEAAVRSSLISQIVVVGQDQRRLAALIVPDREELLKAAKKLSVVTDDSTDLSTSTMMKILRDELTTWTNECTFKIGPIMIVDEPFTIDNGLMTPTMKVRRDKVAEKYSAQISDMYN